MRAVAVPRFREPPELMDLPRPTPGAEELLVRVEFAGMNPFDWKIADGLLEGSRPHVFPLVLGVDAAGTVEAVGARVRRFRVGDAVVGQFLHDPIGTGTYADWAPVPERIGVVQIPSSMSADRAAALPTSGMTALDALDTLALPAGSSLLIVGASGGIGSFATQLATARKLRVSAVARGSSAVRLRSLGAEQVIDPTTADDPVSLVRGAHPVGVDGLLDVMSDRTMFARWVSSVRPNGVAASTTFSANPEAVRRDGVREVNINLQPTADLLGRLVHEVEDHHLTVPVERRVSLAESPAALMELKAGRGHGKAVVDLRP